MASRVNTKFVFILAAVLLVVFSGVAGVAVFVKLKSGERYITLGDKKMAEGDYTAAERFYSLAVNKEQGNVEWLKKWREALSHKVPDTQPKYEEDYRWFFAIHRSLATAERTNVSLHRDCLELFYRQALISGAQRDPWDGLVSLTQNSLAFFDGAPPGDWELLRRYRGLARFQILMAGLKLERRDIEEAHGDLEIALRADPGDGAAAQAMAYWHRSQADAAKVDRDSETERREIEAAKQVLETAYETDPTDPVTLIARLSQRTELAIRDLDRTMPTAALIQATRDRYAALQPALNELESALRAPEIGEMDANNVWQFLMLAAVINPAEANAKTLALIDDLVARRGDLPDLVSVKARLFAASNENEKAIELYQKLVDAPMVPVSLDGMRLWGIKRQAAFGQANCALALSGMVPEGPERDRALERARTFRKALAQLVPESSPELLFVDAKLLLAQNDLGQAQKKLMEYSRVTADATLEAVEALTLQGHIASRLGQDGRASEAFEKALARRGDAIGIRMALAEVELRLQRFQRAIAIYRSVLELDPANKTAADQLEMLQGLVGDPSTITDPVRRTLVQAERKQRGSPTEPGDLLGAIELLKGSLESLKYDPRVVVALANLQSINNDRESAKATLRLGIDQNPDNEGLRNLAQRFDASATLEGTLALIDNADAPKVEKLLGKADVYRQAGMTDDERRMLNEAAAIAPNDSRVVEALFVGALTRKDFTEAQRLTDLASPLDLDRANGLTFRARLHLARGNTREAMQLLRQATEQKIGGPALYRMLGSVQMQLGMVNEAITSYREALHVDPTDRSAIKGLLIILIQSQRLKDALDLAHQSVDIARHDAEFEHLLYTLEAAAGSRSVAISGRESALARNPSDLNNAGALIVLYMEDKAWDKARKLIDRLRGEKDSLALVELDARWHADQGNLEPAKSVYIDYLDRLNVEQAAPMGPEPYMSFGQFLIQRGQTELGIRSMERAAEFQDPATRVADLQRAETLARYGRPADAEKIFSEVLAAGVADPDQAIVSRLIESMIMQDKAAEAEARLAALGPKAESSAGLLALRAAAAEKLGDKRKAREILNRAIELFPQDPLPYYRRAMLSADNPALASDVLADLDFAIRVRPGYWQALHARANLSFARGRDAEAFADLRAAVDANPTHDDLRVTLMNEYISRGRVTDAANVAAAGGKLRPNDLVLHSSLGAVFARARLWTQAAQLYKTVWTASQDELAAALYAGSLIRSTPPAVREAEAVLATPGLKTDRFPGLLMLRAMVRRHQNQLDRAGADARLAYSMSAGNVHLAKTWYETLVELFPDPTLRLALLDSLTSAEPTAGWFNFFKGDTLVAIKDRRADGVRLLQDTAASATDKELLGNIYRSIDGALYADERVEEAVASALKGLEANPDDFILNNNLAAYLNEKLGRTSEALPYATRAAELAPNNYNILDTLAGVYMAMGDKPKAEETLARALTAASRPADKAAVLLRLAKLRTDQSDPGKAGEYAQQIRQMLTENPGLLDQTGLDTLDELERRIRSLR